MTGQFVLDGDILYRSQFGEQTKFLPQERQRSLTDTHPLASRELSDVVSVEQNLSLVVFPIAKDIATKRRLTCTRIGFHKIGLSLLERQLLIPHLAPQVSNLCKDLWQRVFQLSTNSVLSKESQGRKQYRL